MTTQKQHAMQSMVDWLAHENELGKVPNKIECVGEFDLHNMHYYIFKFKASTFGKWLLGVCGGYEHPEDTEHCGHVFSELQPYQAATAVEQSMEMVEMIREYWMNQAAAYEESQKNGETNQEDKSTIFNGFVLLNSHDCNLQQIKQNLLTDWGIKAIEDSEESKESASDATLVFEAEGFMIALSYIDAPVPDGEAEHYAGANYFWPEAVEVTKTHVSQIIIAVLSQGHNAVDTGKMYTMLAASSLKLPNAIGFYSSGTVHNPEVFIDMAQIVKEEGGFPLLNLVYFGIVQSETSVSGYTYGLHNFGKSEIEIVDSAAEAADLYDFLVDISSYVVQYDVTLRDGETIGFTEDQKLPITLSAAVHLEGETIKIGF